MANTASIKAIITAEDRASSVLGSFGSKVGAVAKEATIAIAAAGTAAVAFGIASVKAFSDSENLIAQTNAVLKSTGGIAGITADKVTELATAWQKQTRYSDEAVRGAENVLLTFTSIGKDKFPQATEAVLNLATAMHEDLQSASVQVGKALQDPILGITALRRVGVNFSDAQKDVVKQLVDTGKTAEAQALILKELQKEFGGSAVAAGSTFAGSLDKLKNSFNDVQESIGGTITGYLSPFIQKAADFVASIDWKVVIDKTIGVIKSMWKELDHLYDSVKKIYDQIEDYLEPKFVALWHTIDEKLIPQLLKLWHNVIEPLIPVLGTAFVFVIGAVVDIINGFITATIAVIGWMEKHKLIVEILAGVFGSLAAAMALGAAFDAIIIGFQTLTLVTIPSFIATLSTVGSAFLAAFPFALVVAGLVTITTLIWKAVDAYGQLQAEENKAADGITKLNKQMDDQINKGKISLDQAYKIQNAAGYTGSKTVTYDKNSNTYLPQFATGGYTGGGGKNEVAGLVHKGEYVLPKSMVDQTTGQPKSSGSTPVINVAFNGIFTGNQQEFRKLAVKMFNAYDDAKGMGTI